MSVPLGKRDSTTGGQAAVAALVAGGVDHVFGMTGSHSLGFSDALIGQPIRYVAARSEQGAGYMADAYARCTGRVPVFLTTAGPGALNGMTALGEAHAASSPVLHVCGQVDTRWVDAGKGAFHEVVGLTEILGYVTQWSHSARSGAEVGPAVAHALDLLRRLRPRPVHLDFPQDVLEGPIDAAAAGRSFPEVLAPVPDEAALQRAAQLLRAAGRPLLLAGGGTLSGEATGPLRRLAEALGAPVLTTLSGKGAIPADHALSAGIVPGAPPVGDLLAQADLLLAVGTRFGSIATRNWRLRFPGRIVQLDIDPGELGKNYPVEVGIAGPAATGLERLVELVGNPGKPCWADPPAVRESTRDRDRESCPDAARYLDLMREWLPRSGVVVSDLTTLVTIGRSYLPFYEPRTNLTPIAFGTMGFGFGAGIGAQVACPDREVLCVAGDGGFMMHCGELGTAVQEGLPLTVVLVNDGGYGALRTAQRRKFGGRMIGVELSMPDFPRLAESFGCPATTAASPVELERALAAPHDRRGPRFIELRAAFPHPGFTE